MYRLQAPSYSLLEVWLGTILISIGGGVFGYSLSSPMSHAVDEDTLQSTMLFAMLLGATLRWCDCARSVPLCEISPSRADSPPVGATPNHHPNPRYSSCSCSDTECFGFCRCYPIGAGRAVSLARLLVAMPGALASETVQIPTGEAACEASAKKRDECLAIGTNACQWVHNTCLPSKDPLPPVCEERCTYSSDGECDDGGIGSQYDNCGCGRDCFDCGPRENPMQQCPENWYESDDGFSYAPFSDEWWSGGEGWATAIVFCFFFFFWNSNVDATSTTVRMHPRTRSLTPFRNCSFKGVVWGVFVTQVLLDAKGGMRCFLACFLAPFVWCGLVCTPPIPSTPARSETDRKPTPPLR